MRNCIFCKIIKGKEPARIIYEDKDVICFLPKTIQVYGHTLIVPKKHYKDLYDIPEKLLSKFIITAKKLTLAYRKKISATGTNLLHASGKDGQ
jgi:histidine triad (HIT) family protein